MAIINLTYDVVDTIIGQVHHVFNKERLPLMEQMIEPPKGIGDEIYSWLLPREDNKKILEALPDWHKSHRDYMYIKVNVQEGGENLDYSTCPVIRLPFDEEWFTLNDSWGPLKIAGVEAAVWNSNVLYLYLKDADQGLPSGPAGDFVKKLYGIAKQHADITQKIQTATSTMREFLGQHRTLQTALKECPAIMSYIPDWMQKELARVPPKRTRRPLIPKGEKKEIDMSQLVAQATIAKLNL